MYAHGKGGRVFPRGRPPVDPAEVRAAAAARLRAAAAAHRAAAQDAARRFNVDGDGLPEQLLAAPEPPGFERLAALQRNVSVLEKARGGFIDFQRAIFRNVTIVTLPHLFGADYEAARPRLCATFGTRVLQSRTFVMAPRQTGKTLITMMALGAVVAAGAYLDILFVHVNATTPLKDIAHMVEAAQCCDPTIEWTGDRKGVSFLRRKGAGANLAKIDFTSLRQPDVSPPSPPAPLPARPIRNHALVHGVWDARGAPRVRVLRAGGPRRAAAARPRGGAVRARAIRRAVVGVGHAPVSRRARARLRHGAVARAVFAARPRAVSARGHRRNPCVDVEMFITVLVRTSMTLLK